MIKINKREARKLFNNGKSFYMVSCKMRPEFAIKINDSRINAFRTFDNLINHFSYYNCDYARGYYPAFYIEEN